MKKSKILLTVAAAAFGLAAGSAQAAPELLNASYDVARNFQKEFNPAFVDGWTQKTGETVSINQSHGGPTKQARAVIDKASAKTSPTEIAPAYGNVHHSEKGQEIFAENDIRPSSDVILKKYPSQFRAPNAFTVDQAFGSWSTAQAKPFADGSVVDQIFQGALQK